MLSICIPVFNYDARPLVQTLLEQAEATGKTVEIQVYDDGSRTHFRDLNRALSDHPAVRYCEMSHNLGRAAIRNRMAREATYDRLLMIDVDSRPGPDYLRRYFDAPPSAVLSGGTVYDPTPPGNPQLRLHWNYGRRRETIPPEVRQRSPYHGFQSNNFMVDREVLLRHPLPDVTGYGHEDTLWGQLLAPTSIGLKYIHNPVTHLGLDRNEVFIAKQRRAVRSLRELREQYPTLRTRLTTFADSYPKLTDTVGQLPEKWLVDWLLRTYHLRFLDMLKLKWWSEGWRPPVGYGK